MVSFLAGHAFASICGNSDGFVFGGLDGSRRFATIGDLFYLVFRLVICGGYARRLGFNFFLGAMEKVQNQFQGHPK